jgi:hypothetical protein
MTLNSYVDELVGGVLRKTRNNQSSQMQGTIHPDVLFRFNSINLFVARQGVGKTFAVMKEMIKISQLEGYAGYTTFLYVRNKTNDEIVNEMISLIKIRVRQVAYLDFLPALRDLIDAKNTYDNVIEKGLQDETTDKTHDNLFTTLNLTNWLPYVPHIDILIDDAINILKEPRFKELRDLLFQNRQPRITVFIYVFN